jgi:hypothetical protein
MVIVGLGPSCQTKYQVKRWFAARGNPPELVLFRSVFDRQKTPAQALLAYFRNDFAGLFEFRDLVRGPHSILNGRYDTSHLHRFPKNTSQNEIATHYPGAYQRHEYACAAMRALLALHQPLLFVVGQPLTADEKNELFDQFKARNKKGRRRLLCVNTEGIEPTPGHEEWMGNDALWDAALDAGVFSHKRVFHYPPVNKKGRPEAALLDSRR